MSSFAFLLIELSLSTLSMGCSGRDREFDKSLERLRDRDKDRGRDNDRNRDRDSDRNRDGDRGSGFEIEDASIIGVLPDIYNSNFIFD